MGLLRKRITSPTKRVMKSIEDTREMVLGSELFENLLRKESAALKRMYNLAKNIETLSRRTVELGFSLSCVRALSEINCKKRKDVMAAWVNEANMFARVVLEIFKTLNGVDHSGTKRWEKRVSDQIKSFWKERKKDIIHKYVTR